MAIGQWNPSILDLVPGYLKTIRALEHARKATEDEGDKELLGEMIADCHYCIEWMRRGGNPYRRKGVEKRYSRPWDPKWIDSYNSPNGWYTDRTVFSGELTDMERFRIEDAMRDLSDRERQCYMMYHVDGMSEYDIARELHLGRSTVQDYLERAKKKIEEAKVSSLFLLG